MASGSVEDVTPKTLPFPLSDVDRIREPEDPLYPPPLPSGRTRTLFVLVPETEDGSQGW